MSNMVGGGGGGGAHDGGSSVKHEPSLLWVFQPHYDCITRYCICERISFRDILFITVQVFELFCASFVTDETRPLLALIYVNVVSEIGHFLESRCVHKTHINRLIRVLF